MKEKEVNYIGTKSGLRLMEKVQNKKLNGFYRKGTYKTEIVIGLYSHYFYNDPENRDADFNKGMWLYNPVAKEAKAFVKNNPNFKIPRQYPSEVDEIRKRIEEDPKNEKIINKSTASVDLSHAYWRVAYNLGVITEKTYHKGLGIKSKAVRLSSLSILGTQKSYYKIIDGEFTGKKVIERRRNAKLENVYKLIRFTVYKYMFELKNKLGKDFFYYKVDAIFYRDTPENNELVKNFFLKKKLVFGSHVSLTPKAFDKLFLATSSDYKLKEITRFQYRVKIKQFREQLQGLWEEKKVSDITYKTKMKKIENILVKLG